MVRYRGFLTASLIAMMAVGGAHAESMVITTGAWVESQIQPVETKIDNHIDNSDIHVTAEQKSAWSNKQDAISDIADIRAGAALGATAVQPDDLDELVGNLDLSNTYETKGAAATVKSEIEGKLDDGANGYDIDAKSLAVQGTPVLTSHQTITTGTTDGTIKVGDTDVAVAGLGSAAYKDASAFDAAGTAADAIAALDLANTYQPKGNYATAAQGALAETALQSHQTITTGTTDGTIKVGDTDVAVAGLGSAAYEDASAFDAAGTAADAIAALDLANTYQPKGNYATAAQGALAETALQSHQDISGKENVSNKVTATTGMNTNSTTQYPSMATAQSMIEDTLGTYVSGLSTTIAGKQPLLVSGGNNPNVVSSGEGDVVTNVSATNGVVTVTKGTTLGPFATKSEIELSDLSSGVQTSLGLADSALQPGDMAGYGYATTVAMNNALADKQDVLTSTNVVNHTGDTGNVVTSVVADDGVVTVTRGITAIPMPPDSCENTTNKCVLTYNNSVFSWEVIGR